MLKLEENLHVVSLELKDGFVLVVIDFKHFVFLGFHLFLEEYVIVCGLHQADSEVSWDNNVHNIDLLDNNTVGEELFIQLVHECRGKLGLNISDSANFDFLDEISDSLLAFLLEKLLKSVGSEIVEEFFAVLFISLLVPSDMEVDTDIEGNPNIVLGRNILDGTLVSYCIL